MILVVDTYLSTLSSITMRNKSLVDFIKTDLGCKCPEEIFLNIEVSVKSINHENISIVNRVLVGERLLIYFVPASLRDLEEPFLKEMFSTGKADRDENNYNRFRLVVVTPESELTICEQKLKDEFKTKVFDGDEKLHLHVIGSNQVPGELAA